MYFRIVFSSKPTVLTQYPRDQKFSPVTLLFPVRRWMITALLPFKNPMTNATLNLGGILKHMWTWSGINCPSNISTPRCRDNSRNISPTSFFTLPYSFLFRYLGTITTWYLQSHLTCDKLCQSCIGNSSCFALRGFPEELPILFLTGTVVPFRILHQRADLYPHLTQPGERGQRAISTGWKRKGVWIRDLIRMDLDILDA